MTLNRALALELDIMRERIEKITTEAYSNPPTSNFIALSLYSKELENMKNRAEDILTKTDKKLRV